MIAALADDFTGAAEIAAIGRRYGLTSEVHTGFDRSSAADLVVIDTLTRSCSREEAARRVARAAADLRDGGISGLYYKKVDSVLRGHVAAELATLMNEGGLERTLLVPANPSFGQLIRDGLYSIDGRPLDETRFAQDPEHPAATSDVLALLGSADGVPISYRQGEERLPEKGIVLAGGVAPAGLLTLAGRLPPDALPAGGAEFFDALLQLRLGRAERPPPGDDAESQETPTLLIVGSATQPSRVVLKRAREAGVRVLPMPGSLYRHQHDGAAQIASWAESALDCLSEHGHAILSVDPMPTDRELPPVAVIPTRLAEVAAAVSTSWPDRLSLYVSGGTTASTVVRRLGWRRLGVVSERSHAVATLRPHGVQDRTVTVKPGSYPWPDAIVRRLT